MSVDIIRPEHPGLPETIPSRMLNEFVGSSQSSVECGSEAAGVEEGSADVVAQVTEAESGASEVLEPTVDRLSRAVAGAGMIEERQDVSTAFVERPA